MCYHYQGHSKVTTLSQVLVQIIGATTAWSAWYSAFKPSQGSSESKQTWGPIAELDKERRWSFLLQGNSTNPCSTELAHVMG